MTSEDIAPRPRPAKPYQPDGRRLFCPPSALEATLLLLRRFGPLEACAFWFGQRDEAGDARVRAVIAPRQAMHRGFYDVPAACTTEMADHVEPMGLKPLAQIHSHPGRLVEHSRYDDRMASSRRALSLVIPLYGHWRETWPTGVGVHEYQEGYWHLLSQADASRRVLLTGDDSVHVADLRT